MSDQPREERSVSDIAKLIPCVCSTLPHRWDCPQRYMIVGAKESEPSRIAAENAALRAQLTQHSQAMFDAGAMLSAKSEENAALRDRVSALSELADANSVEVRGILTVGETVKDGIVRLFKEAAALRADLANERSRYETLEHYRSLYQSMQARLDAALAEVGRVKGALVTTAIRASEVETLVRKAIPWIRPVHQVPPKCECERCQWVQSALAALTPPAPPKTGDKCKCPQCGEEMVFEEGDAGDRMTPPTPSGWGCDCGHTANGITPPAQQPAESQMECSCYEVIGGHQAGCPMAPPAPQQKPAHASVLPECCGDTVAGCTNCQPAPQQEKPRED